MGEHEKQPDLSMFTKNMASRCMAMNGNPIPCNYRKVLLLHDSFPLFNDNKSRRSDL